MSLDQRIEEIISEFNAFNSWEDRYRLLIKFGRQLESLDDCEKQEKFRIKGCQSQVWLVAQLVEGKLHFRADSDALLVKGIIALLVKVFSGESPKVLMSAKADFLNKIGIQEHLSLNRTNGLASMLKQIQLYAHAMDALVNKGVLNVKL